MRLIYLPVLVLLSSTAFASRLEAGEGPAPAPEERRVTITVLYDNRRGAADLDSGWGFACLVEGLSETILFDTGGDGPTLLGNMAKLGIAPERVDVVVLSHEHGDHTGGLEAFLDAESAVKVYLLRSFPGGIADAARARGAQVIEVEQPVEICPGATVSGDVSERNEVDEQYLLVACGDGVAVVTGCAHPGIVDVVEHARDMSGRDVLVVVGGFHLFRQSDAAVDETIRRLKELGVRHAVPCHCTGDRAIERFAVSYGDRFTRCTAGTIVDVGALLGGVGPAR